MDKKLLRIYQLSDGYCYNSDSLFLFDFAKLYLKSHWEILDIGCGSGIIGLLCARDFRLKATLVEKDLYSAFLAHKNALLNGLDAQVFCSDIFEIDFDKKFNVILSNPPFYRQEIIDSVNERIRVARNARYMPFDLLCKKVKRNLHPNGHFIFCYDAKEVHHIFHTLKDNGLYARTCRFVYPRVDKEATLILIEAKINSKSSLKILPPLITHNSMEQKDNTPEVQRIYKDCNTYSIKVCSQDIKEEDARLFSLSKSL
ncbi:MULTISPECIES: tRNA1(Val) (adenine(37)-N6)-methyltransferase [unclassified Helicobacter]|uniref:tRNA1(Val) (adenine(37)-N6)-methyltransferase n=1 Tax=unclassified Helicobacter TaxID=2593540 RepID=UPI000CF17ED2|nr:MULTISPECIES: methyltransferase [unclassified Helicobacter]